MKDNLFIFHELFNHKNFMPFSPNRLRMLRKQRGWSQYRLSIEANLERAYINLLESGKRKNPGFETVEKLAECFKVNMETFRTGTLI